MINLARSILFVHILFGTLALFVSPAAMITHKGGLWHRRWGKVYFWSMAVVAISAVLLSVLRPQLFLPMVAVFSFYLAFTGYRVLYRKTPRHQANALDWVWTILMLLGGAGLVCYGVLLLRNSSFGTVAIVFGGIGLLLGISDGRTFLNLPDDKRAWWFTHMTRMLAAYIATVTALLPRWLWPTAAGLIGIFAWRRYYQNKFNSKNVQSKTVIQGEN